MLNFFWICCLLGGCTQNTSSSASPIFSGNLQAWVDKPLDQATLPFPVEYELVCHGTDPSGVKAIQFNTNGTVLTVSTNVEAKNTLFHTSVIWQPATPGDYLITCRAQNNSDAWSAESAVRVKVIAATPSVTPTLTPTITPTLTPTITPTSTPTPPAQTAIEFSSRTSSSEFQYQRDCIPNPAQVTITALLSNAANVKFVFLFFRLESSALGVTSAWNSGLMMSPAGNLAFTRTLSWRDIPQLDQIRGSSATFVYQFVAVDENNNNIARSQRFYDVRLSPCN